MPDTMPTINSVNVNSTDYEIEDTVARTKANEALELFTSGASKPSVVLPEQEDEQWVYHRNTYRGKYLGDTYTDEQKAMIAANTFDDLYVGDFWTINDITWIIADINYWLGTGDTRDKFCTTPHAVIVPLTSLYNHAFNSSETTAGGYIGSSIRTSGLVTAKETIRTAFGEGHILTHRETFSNTVTNGMVSGGAWVDSDVDIMNQLMTVGSMAMTVGAGANSSAYNITIDKVQLSLFALRPQFIKDDSSVYYLRDILTTSYVSTVGMGGEVGRVGANQSRGVRPIFGITG